MATPEDGRPEYVGVDWAAPPQGYRFLRPPPDEPAESGEWARLLGVFGHAREGRFEASALLPELIRDSTDRHLRLAALRLMGDACRSDTSAAVAEFFADPDESVRLASYAAAACTGKLDVARLLTRHGFELRRGVERDLLADALSEMLGNSPDEFVEPADYESYAAAVAARIRNLELTIGQAGCVLFGSAVDIGALVSRILLFADMDDPEPYVDLIEHYVLRFEAMTGARVSEWFDQDETLNPRKVSNAMHDFQIEKTGMDFVRGRRYFFKYLIDA